MYCLGNFLFNKSAIVLLGLLYSQLSKECLHDVWSLFHVSLKSLSYAYWVCRLCWGRLVWLQLKVNWSSVLLADRVSSFYRALLSLRSAVRTLTRAQYLCWFVATFSIWSLTLKGKINFYNKSKRYFMAHLWLWTCEDKLHSHLLLNVGKSYLICCLISIH